MRRTIVMTLLLLVPVSAAVVKTAGRSETSARDTLATEKWEYLVVAGPSSTNFSPTGNPEMRKEVGLFGREGFVLEQHLDKLGAKGWELVALGGPPSDPVYYFKRAKQ